MINPYLQPIYQTNAYPTQMNVGPTQPQQNVGNQQIQNGGFISVRSEQEVFNYPVAPGNCVTFKIEGQPIVMEKSMGFSQLEAPHVERYRLVKEDVVEKSQILPQNESFDTKSITNTIDEIQSEIEAIWGEINGIKTTPKKVTPAAKKKEVKDDDSE